VFLSASIFYLFRNSLNPLARPSFSVRNNSTGRNMLTKLGTASLRAELSSQIISHEKLLTCSVINKVYTCFFMRISCYVGLPIIPRR
jgi:hypothetical protein